MMDNTDTHTQSGLSSKIFITSDYLKKAMKSQAAFIEMASGPLLCFFISETAHFFFPLGREIRLYKGGGIVDV